MKDLPKRDLLEVTEGRRISVELEGIEAIMCIVMAHELGCSREAIVKRALAELYSTFPQRKDGAP